MKPRILVVDDDEIMLRPLQRTLEAYGYDVLAVASAEDALLSLAATEVHVLVTDQGLPGISGLELIDRVREAWPTLPIVLITGSRQSDLDQSTGQRRITAALLKPFEPEHLLAAVDQALSPESATGAARSIVGESQRSAHQVTRRTHASN